MDDMRQKVPVEQLIEEMIASACPDAADETVRSAAQAVLSVGMHRAPTAADARSFGERFGAALGGSVGPVRATSGEQGRSRAVARDQVLRLYQDEISISQIAARVGLKRGTVRRLLMEAGVSPRELRPSGSQSSGSKAAAPKKSERQKAHRERSMPHGAARANGRRSRGDD